MRNLVAAWTDELDDATGYNTECVGLVSYILNCQAVLASQRALRARNEDMQRFQRCREERDVMASKAALLERQVGELAAARDEAIVALHHAQSDHKNAHATEREKAEVAEISWHAADRARVQLAEQLAAAHRDCEAATLWAEEEAKRAADTKAELAAIRTDPLKDANVMGDLVYYIIFVDAIRDMKRANLSTAPWRSP